MSSLVSGLRAQPSAVALAAAAALALATPLANAQTSTLDPVSVTATRGAAQRVDQALAEVTVLDRADLEAQAGRSLAEVLAAQPGVQFWSNGGLGKTASVSLRGLEARHTLLLIDGVRYGSATLGLPIWDNLPLDAIERIEIVRGPLSALYGSDAVGGVVQVFTRKARGAGLKAHGRVAVGSHGLRQGSAGLNWAEGAVDASLGLQTLRDEGFSATNPRERFGSHNPDRDGLRQRGLTGRLGVKLGGDWRAELLGQDQRGKSQYDDGPGADSRTQMNSRVLALQVGGTVSGRWHSQVRVSRSVDESDVQVSASPWMDLGVTGTTQQQIAWENQLQTDLGRVLLLAERLEQDVTRPGQAYEVSHRSIDAYAAGLTGAAGAHHWQLAARHDRNSQFGHQNTGSAAYGYALSEAWRLGASLGTSFVAPSFNQLYYPSFGNPNLQPEEGRHQELFAQWAQGAHQLRVAAFDNRIRGYISSGPAPTNIPRARIKGLSLSYDLSWAGWTLNASADHLDPRNASQGTAQLDKLLPRRAKTHLRLGLEHSWGDWTLGGQLRHAGKRYENATNTLEVAGHTVLDLRADWRLNADWALGLKLNNVADKAYETATGYNQPGREWQVVLRWGR
ncbi:TonB-dependent receptor domain-containing protein [Inhella gelatinilytica]|nr:TonB-dependent receptor [Inhella gelatinilytica]